MDQNKFLEIVTKYLSKRASHKEIELLNSLLKEEKYNRFFIFLSEKWNEPAKSNPLSEYNSKAGIQELTRKICKQEPSFIWSEEKKEKFPFVFQPAFFRFAVSLAVVTMLTLGVLFIAGILNLTPSHDTWSERKTAQGEILIFTFFDGTKVTLNADSRLQYPKRFGEHAREIYLSGQAYFEVAHDSSKPFIVHSGSLATTVLGTKFNINAYPEENEIKVSLVEGKVEVVNAEAKYSKENVVLHPHQQLIYNKNEEIGVVGSFDFQTEVGWKDNILKFDKVPLAKMFPVLERSYGVKLELANKSYGSRVISANFDNASLLTVLEVIKKLTNLKYRSIKENDSIKKVIFY